MGEIVLASSSSVETPNESLRALFDTTPLLLSGTNNLITPTININSSSVVSDLAGSSVSGNELTLPEGKYQVNVVVNSQSSGNARVSHALELLVNNVAYSVTEPTDYKRILESHVNSSNTLVDLIVLNTTSTISIQMIQRSGNGGGSAQVLDTSRITVMKL